jgi:hypothetical protein
MNGTARPGRVHTDALSARGAGSLAPRNRVGAARDFERAQRAAAAAIWAGLRAAPNTRRLSMSPSYVSEGAGFA